jgi:hypothetical protein
MYKITGNMFFDEAANSNHYIKLILTPFLRDLTEEEKVCSYFMKCHGRHSKFLNDCPKNDTLLTTDMSQGCGLPDPHI